MTKSRTAPASPPPPTAVAATAAWPEAPKRRSRARPSPPSAEPPAPLPPEPSTKLDILAALLSRKEGATVAQLMEATGWQQHSVRGALAGAMSKRFGAKVLSGKVDGVRIYRAPC